jgi:plastocyanin
MARLALCVAAVALVAAVAPALAADHTVTATASDQFSPPTITIAAGDRVLFRNSGGSHNFVFEDGPAYPANPTGPGAVWDTLSRTFTESGSYPYYCDAHGAAGGVGMSGVITVAATSPTPSPTPGPTATPTPGPGATPTPEPGGDDSPPRSGSAVRVRSLAIARARRSGVRVRIDLSAPARVKGVLRRGGRRFGRVDFGTVAAGPRTLRLRRTTGGRRLVAGRYSLTLRVGGAATKRLRFRIR